VEAMGLLPHYIYLKITLEEEKKLKKKEGGMQGFGATIVSGGGKFLARRITTVGEKVGGREGYQISESITKRVRDGSGAIRAILIRSGAIDSSIWSKKIKTPG